MTTLICKQKGPSVMAGAKCICSITVHTLLIQAPMIHAFLSLE